VPVEPRDPSDVIDAVLRRVPAQRSVLRTKLSLLKVESARAAPENKGPVWWKLKRLLESELSTPPKLYWEQQVSDVVRGLVAE
jgi:hypothetical protein